MNPDETPFPVIPAVGDLYYDASVAQWYMMTRDGFVAIHRAVAETAIDR